MTKPTVASLTARLDRAARIIKAMDARIQALEAKQLSPKLAKRAGPGLAAAIQRTAERDAAAAATR
jgi:hypothetical protein